MSTVAPTEVFSTITTAQTDADSPVDVTLMGSYRGNLINLNEQMLGPSTAPLYVAGQAHTHDGIGSAPIVLKTYTAGTHVIFRSTAVSTGETSTSFSDQLIVGLPFAGSLKIRYDLSPVTTGVGSVWGNIYRNGSAVGTEATFAGGSSRVTLTEDVAGWQVNDILQIRTKAVFGNLTTAVAKNLTISVTTASISQIAISKPLIP